MTTLNLYDADGYIVGEHDTLHRALVTDYDAFNPYINSLLYTRRMSTEGPVQKLTILDIVTYYNLVISLDVAEKVLEYGGLTLRTYEELRDRGRIATDLDVQIHLEREAARADRARRGSPFTVVGSVIIDTEEADA